MPDKWAPARPFRRLARTGLPLWAFTLFTLLTATGWLAWSAYTDYRAGIVREYRLLEIGARDREARVAGVMRGIEVMLGTIEEDWASKPRMPEPAASRMLRENMRQLPEVRSLSITDAQGRIIASTLATIVGFDAAQREYFTAVRAAQPDDRLHISRPFKTVTDVVVITVARALHDKQGDFVGVIVATIDPRKFGEILPFSLPTPDGNALLIHEAGDIVYAVPEPERYVGRNLVGGQAYTQHLAAATATTRHRNVTKNSGKEVLSIFHKVPGTPLIVVVSRDYASLMADWQHAMFGRASGFILVAAIMLFLTWLAGRHQQALQAERDRNQLYLDTVQAIVLALDANGRIAMINRHGAQLLGGTPQALIGRDWFESCLPQPEGRDTMLPIFRRLMRGDTAGIEYIENRVMVADGSLITVAWHNAPMRDAKGHIVGTLSAGEDISARKRNEQALKDSERFLRSLIDIIPGMVGYWSADLKNGFANAAYREWFGKTPAEIRGIDIRELMGQEQFERNDARIRAALAGKRQRFERSLHHADGSIRHTWTHYIPDSVDGEVRGFFVLISDITEMKLAQLQLEKLNTQLKTQSDQLRAQVFIDGLTGIANRRRFDEALRTEWRGCRRHDQPLALLMLDIDHFKLFNDRYGHQAGDACLQAVAQVLKAALRRPHDLAARYGGEEFVCLLPDSDRIGAETKAEELRQAVAALGIAHAASPTAPHVTVSVGVAVWLPSGDSAPERLLADSDAALYMAKNGGRNRVCTTPPDPSYASWESRRSQDGESANSPPPHSALSQ
jgi:diguanylate cyclase (GGDEF)-like protein/PAS domain S-box-containing protein